MFKCTLVTRSVLSVTNSKSLGVASHNSSTISK